MTLELKPFSDDKLDAAAELLALRHRRDRQSEPSLPERFEDTTAAREAIAEILRKPGATGIAALRAGRLVGYLLGTYYEHPMRGRFAWADLAGHALDPGETPSLYRDLYAALSPRWLAAGCFAHLAYIPASDRSALDAWFSIGFGQEQLYAVRDFTEEDKRPLAADPPFTIRRATSDDLEFLMQVGDLIGPHYESAPIFSPYFPLPESELREVLRDFLQDQSNVIWLAVEDGQALGMQAYLPAERSDDDPLILPERSLVLQVAATRPHLRGRGVGRFLTAHAFQWAASAGYLHCVSDWRSANLVADRFWLARGFRPVTYRLARYLDPRIAWQRASLTNGAQSRERGNRTTGPG